MGHRTALITGAGGGLGHATVERLVAKGWKVFAADIRTDLLRSSMHDPDVVPIVMDVTDRESIRSAYETISSHTDRLDGVVNFAGVMGLGSLTDIPEERLARILDINVMGTFRVNKTFLPLLEVAKGRIVNISSGAAVKAIEGWSAYCVAKAGLTHLTRLLAAEEPDITTVALRPGVVDTAMQATIRRDGPGAMTVERVAYFQNLKDRGELLAPEAPGRIAGWLALHAPREWSGELIEWDDPRLP